MQNTPVSGLPDRPVHVLRKPGELPRRPAIQQGARRGPASSLLPRPVLRDAATGSTRRTSMGGPAPRLVVAKKPRVAPALMPYWGSVRDDGLYGMPELMRDLVTPGKAQIAFNTEQPARNLAERSICEWLGTKATEREGKEILKFLRSHRNKVLYSLTMDDIRKATTWKVPSGEGTAHPFHALGPVDKKNTCIDAVEDWATSPWAYNFIFHQIMEEMGRIPMWPEVLHDIEHRRRDRVMDYFEREFRFGVISPAEVDRHYAALRWRLGKAYYSFVREVALITELRCRHGIEVHFNLLADVQLKVDLFYGRSLLEVFIGSEKMRKKEKSRKLPCTARMDTSGFVRHVIELDAPKQYGLPALVQADAVARLAAELRAENPELG